MRKRKAEDWDEWKASVADVRCCKRRRSAWLRSKEVAWWDQKAQQVQDKADQGDAFGVFATFKELPASWRFHFSRRGSSSGCPF